MVFRKIVSIAINLIAVIISIIGFVLIRDSLSGVIFVKYFTLVTNTLIVFVGLLSIGYGIDSILKKDEETSLPTFVFALKLITATCALITFLTVVTYLQYTAYKGIGPDSPMFWNNLFHHYIAPLAFVSGLVFFDLDKKYSFKLSGIFSEFIIVE